jgi:hypothetical protein
MVIVTSIPLKEILSNTYIQTHNTKILFAEYAHRVTTQERSNDGGGGVKRNENEEDEGKKKNNTQLSFMIRKNIEK